MPYKLGPIGAQLSKGPPGGVIKKVSNHLCATHLLSIWFLAPWTEANKDRIHLIKTPERVYMHLSLNHLSGQP